MQSLLHVKRYTSEHLATAAENTRNNEILRRMLFQAAEDLRLLEVVFTNGSETPKVDVERYGRLINQIRETPCKSDT
jgi:hypothetical protein